MVAYYSRLYAQSEVNYCTTPKELLAVVEGLRQFRSYVLGRHCVIRTDHAALRWFWRAPNLVGQQARWLDFLGEFDFEIIYRPGARHRNADALSRRRCRTCTFCQSGVDGGKVKTRVTGVVETTSAGGPVSEVWNPINWWLHKPQTRSWPCSMGGVQSQRNLPLGAM